MAATLIAAALTCFSAVFLGQAVLRACGAERWSWLAPQVGISVGMILTVPVIHLPGRMTTGSLLLLIAVLAAAAWCLSSADHRPPGDELLAAAPVAFLTLIPFIASGHAGIPGVGLDNDMAAHLAWAEAYVSRAVNTVTLLPPEYPLGPHASSAAIATGTGMRIDHAFAGWGMALPILNALTAVALVKRPSWLGKAAVATVVGMPFLIAAYYGEGSFKEVLQAGLVLAFVIFVAGEGPRLKPIRRWVPVAILVAGMVSVYSVTGLPWPLTIGAAWLAVIGGRELRAGGLKGLRTSAKSQIAPIGVALAALAVLLLPQLPRIVRFIGDREGVNGTGIAQGDLGNLIGSLPLWEAFGVWGNGDFRLSSVVPLTILVVVLSGIGAIWALRRGRWLLPTAALCSLAIWAISSLSQSPYVNAKALVIASPLLLALAILPLVEGDDGRRRRAGFLAPVLAVVLLFAVVRSDVAALRFSPVGPTDHLEELRSLRPTIAVQPTLFLGNDDFARWELAGVPISTTTASGGFIPLRPEKKWKEGQAFDFDTVTASTLNQFPWVITPRDSAGSAPPPQMTLAKTTENFELWRRTAPVSERLTLAEGGEPGAILDCSSPEGKRVVAGGGVAATRTRPIAVSVPVIGAGESDEVDLVLPRGSWSLTLQYESLVPVEVHVDAFTRALVANKARLGPRWPVGRIDILRKRKVGVELEVEQPTWAPSTTAATMGKLTAVPLEPDRVLPVRVACGRFVDWYRPAR